jgi:PAS domain S-box-containing protein
MNDDDEDVGRAGRIAQLESELARYRALFDGVPDPLAESDVRGVLRAVNPLFAKLLGVHPTFLFDKPLLHFVTRRDTRAFRDFVRTLGTDGTEAKLVVHFRPRHGGLPFAAEVSARVVSFDSARQILWCVRPIENDPRAALTLVADAGELSSGQ